MVDDVLLVCKKLRHIENFFDYPLESKLLGVLLVHELREEDCLLSVKLFKCKYLKVANMLPFPWLITKISYNDSCIILPPYVSLCPSLLQWVIYVIRVDIDHDFFNKNQKIRFFWFKSNFVCLHIFTLVLSLTINLVRPETS